ncbi:hypothetical protein LPTSP3_g17780 [Leptospira kobayashii]|uniref:Uncharacterized protein n=1 Tax=Leptospira kobayashii TaxID=1917830 RepID=A0ABN6KD45_9LEPT|nr:hypothetical protein [Leptospira kobayashii]BDA78848.1 hypothetical protein LPTSP3_g17780 [Leptospira kobayashii]
MHPKSFDSIYLKKAYLENELKRMLQDIAHLDYRDLNDYDKGGFDGYNQALTEILKKLKT